MSETTDRIKCPNCGANNFPSSTACWQCGKPLGAQTEQEVQPPQEPQAPAAGAPPPPPQPTPQAPPPTVQPGMQTPPPPPPQAQWPQPPPPPPPAYPPPRQGGQDTQIFIILGFIGVVLGLCCCPFAVMGIIFGAIAHARGDRMGLWLLIAGIVVCLINIVVGILLVGSGNWPPKQPWVPRGTF